MVQPDEHFTQQSLTGGPTWPLAILVARRGDAIASVAIVAAPARPDLYRKARTLAIDERASDPEAAIVLAQGIAALNAIYNEIDIAEGQLYRAGLASGRSS